MFNNKNIINLIKKKLFCITVNFKQTKLTKDDHWTGPKSFKQKLSGVIIKVFQNLKWLAAIRW